MPRCTGRFWLMSLLTACAVDEVEREKPDQDTSSAPEELSDAPGSHGDDEEDEASFLYEPAITDLGLEVDAETVAVLSALTAVDDAADVHATLVYGEERLDVGLKLRGSIATWSPWTAKPALKIDVGQWVDGQTLHGTRRITLNNMVRDDSKLAEHAAYALYAAAGVPTPRHGYVRLTVNGEPYGLYGVVETQDEQFVKRNWDDNDGPFYEADGDLVASDLGQFSYAERPDVDDDDAALRELVDALATSTPDTVLGVLDAHFDRDRLFGFWAVDLLTGNTEAYTTQAKNYYLYWEPETGRWDLVPWSTDLAFSANLDVTGLHAGYAYQLCLTSPECTDALRTRMGEVVDLWETMGLTEAIAAQADLIAADCAADTHSPTGAAGCTAGRDRVEAFLAARPEEVRAQLGLD